MSVFQNDYNKAGPGVEKDEKQKTGMARFAEILFRDFIDFIKLNFFVTITAVPTGILAAGYFLAEKKAIIFLILAWVMLVLVGPAITALCRVTIKRIQDSPCFVWLEFKNVYKKNFKTSVLYTQIIAIIYAVIGFGIYDALMNSEKLNIVLLACFFVLLYTVTAISNFVYAQIGLVDIPFKAVLKNSVLLMLGRANRVLPAVLLQIIVFGAAILFLPVTLIVFVTLLFGIMSFVTNFILWPAVKLVCNEEISENNENIENTENDITNDDNIGN